MQNLLKNINSAILDMDGVLWRSDIPLCDLNILFQKFNDNNIKVVLASNNATRTVDEVVEKILKMGGRLEKWQIVTSGTAICYLLKNKYPNGGSIFIMGTPALKVTLEECGFYQSDADPQAVGINSDPTYPTSRGLEPGAGACIAAVQVASGITPILAGKPNPYLFSVAMERLKTQPEKTLVIGDRLDTDILGGFRAGCKTALVLTGVSTREDLKNWSPQPDLILENIMSLFL
jgi:4-nitrophenyl phosphatase